MSEALRRRILSERDAQAADPRFADRLIEGVRQIEAVFEGPERDRLLSLVAETLDRHLEIRRCRARTGAALERLRADQERIGQMLRLLVTPRADHTLH